MRAGTLARRRLLSAVASLLAGCQADSTLPEAPIVPADATGIDVHCHVFNARDLPVPGFVLHVVLEEYQAVLDLPLGPLVTMLSLIADWGIRDADAEIAALESGAERPFAAVRRRGPPLPSTLGEKARAAALAMQAARPDARSQAVIDQGPRAAGHHARPGRRVRRACLASAPYAACRGG